MDTTPGKRSTARTNDGRDQSPADSRAVAGPENGRNGAAKNTKNTDAQEDWLSLATADPSFWLRDADL